MLSTRELWNIVTGCSSLKDNTSVGDELERFKPLLENVLNYYKHPNSESQKKVTSSNTVKRKNFLIKLSKILNLDEWQTHELFINYLRLDFRGSGPQLQAILKHDTQLEGFYLKLLEFYYKERLFLLKCIKYFITYWQDDSCLYREQFAKIVDFMASKNVINLIIQQLKDLFKTSAGHTGIKGNQHAEIGQANQYAREMCELAEIIFLYYKDFVMSSKTLMDMATFLRKQHFGASQVNYKLLSINGIVQMQKFEIISSLILVEGIDLELLRKGSSVDQSELKDHHLLKLDDWKQIDKLLYSWDDMLQQGPILIAWSIFRYSCLSTEEQQLTSHFGDAAMRCHLMLFLQHILDHPLYSQNGDGVSCLVRSHIYIIMTLLLKIFQEDTLGDFNSLVSIAKKVLSEPVLSSLFLAEDQENGIGLLLSSAKKYYPHMVLPYVEFLTSLSSDRDSADIIFDSFEGQDTLTELFGQNTIDEIEAIDEYIWKRKQNRKIIEYGNDAVALEENALGRVFLDKQDTRLIQWKCSYSGWLYVLLELNQIIESPMTYTSGSGEDGLSVAKCYVSFVNAILSSHIQKLAELEPVIGTIIALVKRLAQLRDCPTELLGECLKCLHLVMQEQPIEIWQHLSEIQFLPHQKNNDLSDNITAMTMLPGSYGNILTKTEVPNHVFQVTKEYLKIVMTILEVPFDTLLNAGKGGKVYVDVAVNVVLVIKEIFAYFGRWKFSSAEDKEVIALKCLEIFHQLLSPKNEENCAIKEKKLPSLREIVSNGLLHHGAGEALLAIISVGVDSLSITLDNDIRQGTDVIQVLKLSFAVLNHLLTNLDKSDTLTPLEQVVSQNIIQQPSDLDFMHPFCNQTMLSVIAKFIFHQQDPKLPILAVLALRTLAVRFPLILTSSFGDALVGIRNAFVNRLNGRVEAVRLKVAILEFLTVCVESQPGIVESFTHLQQDKDKKSVVGKFSCLPSILEILENKEQIDVLTSTALEFVAALWRNRYDGAMGVLKNSKTFWESITNPLKMIGNAGGRPIAIETLQHTLDIISTETYYIRTKRFDERLKPQLSSLCNESFYTNLADVFGPTDDVTIATKKLSLIKSFQTFVIVMNKSEEDYCNLTKESTLDLLVRRITEQLNEWTMKEKSPCFPQIISELSNLISTFTRTSRLMGGFDKILSSLTETMILLSTTDRTTFQDVMLPLFTSILVIFQKHNKIKAPTSVCSSLVNLICCHLYHHDDKDDSECQFKQHAQVNINSLSLLNLLIHQIPKESLSRVVQLLQSQGTINNLIHDMKINLKKQVNLEYIEVILGFFLSCVKTDILAEHISNSGLGKFICLGLHNLPTTYRSSAISMKLWSLVIALLTTSLKTLKFSFLQTAVDFLGAYQEVIFQSMNIVEELLENTNLVVTEQISILCYELSQYKNDVEFLLPEVHEKLKYGISQLVNLSIALLSRQKLLVHLTEFKSSEELERLLNRAKTPSPVSFRSDSSRSMTDASEKLTGPSEIAQNRLINILCYCLGSLRRQTPNVAETILDEGMDIDSFQPLVDMKFHSPSLELNDSPTFGTLLSCVNVSLRMIHKLVQGDPERATPEKDPLPLSLSFEGDKQRSALWFIIENSLVIILSQASCYLRHPNIEESGKQFLKRELGSELTNIRYAVQRSRSRRGVPPSPESSDRLMSGSSLSSFRRSPSRLSTSLSINEEDENSLLKLVDSYTKFLLR